MTPHRPLLRCITSPHFSLAQDFVSDVDRSLWWHYIAVITPNTVAVTDRAMIYMTGGDNNNGSLPHDATDEEIALIGLVAVQAQAVACVL